MAERIYNPFSGIDLMIPEEFRDSFNKYCQKGGHTLVDMSPFPRMIDLWFLALCIAVRQKLKPADLGGRQTYKFIDGTIFASDPWRIHALMLVAISVTKDIHVVADPRKVITITNGLAIAGIPRVLDMLREGAADPIWNLSEQIEEVITQRVD